MMNMFRYLLAVFVLAGIMIFEFYRYRSVVCSTVVYPVMWILSILGLLASKDRIWPVGNVTLIIIVTGYFLFTIGFELSYVYSTKHPKKIIIRRLRPISIGQNLITLVSAVICLFFIHILWQFIDFSDFFNSWVNVRYKVLIGEIKIPYILTVLRYFVRCSLWILAFLGTRANVGLCNKGNFLDKETTKEGILIILRIGVVCLFGTLLFFYDFSRNDILFICLPILFMLLFTDRKNNRRNIIILTLSFLLFIAFYLWFMSYRELANMQESFSIVYKIKSLLNYLSGSLKAMDEDIMLGNIKMATTGGGGGVYTLSAFIGIFERFFGGNHKLDVMERVIQIGDCEYTNVYTFYHWTAKDFGIIYSLGWQLILGMIYGRLYYSSIKGNDLSLYVYCVLAYPLMMMFFQDQYFSIGQSWIILVSFSLIIIVMMNLVDNIYEKYR